MTGTKKYLDKTVVKAHEEERLAWKAWKSETASVNKRLVKERIMYYSDF